MVEKKLTKKELFGQARELAIANGREDLVAFIDHEIDLLNKKASASGESKTQKENLAIMDRLYSELANIDRAVTISEFQANSEYASTLSNQKISALFKKMVEAGRVVKTTEKKKSYFSVVAE
jgi:hypothetical protein